jgi:hypothetical protein
MRAARLPDAARVLRWLLVPAAAGALFLLCFQFAALRGTETDLFPRWHGLRELLLHGRDPYGAAVTAEIAASTPFLHNATDPATRAAFGFLYPLPGALLLAPLALLPYQAALALWLVFGLLALPAAALLAVLARRPDAPPSTRFAALALSLTFLPSLWNVTLAQPGLAVPSLVALALYLSPARPFASGACLALATVLKPQLVLLLAVSWGAVHAWRAVCRQAGDSARFLAGAAVAVVTLTAAATALLPGWLTAFAGAASHYTRVPAMAPSAPALVVVFGAALPPFAAIGATAVVGTALLVWLAAGWRSTPNTGERCIRVDALRGPTRAVTAGALLVPPSWETSSVVLLLPLSIALADRSGRRAALFVAASAALSLFLAPISLFWPWRAGALIACAYALFLVAVSLIPPAGAPAPGAAGRPGRA